MGPNALITVFSEHISMYRIAKVVRILILYVQHAQVELSVLLAPREDLLMVLHVWLLALLVHINMVEYAMVHAQAEPLPLVQSVLMNALQELIQTALNALHVLQLTHYVQSV
jgi:hypothetical protein